MAADPGGLSFRPVALMIAPRSGDRSPIEGLISLFRQRVYSKYGLLNGAEEICCRQTCFLAGARILHD
ncbi:hypothetical protein CGMCC3_g10687 [Colletotrichum fructicola]|nr:uncharacterized protein CGMCC3_g10687 [Colletotrichum fructicola]KAE9573365.1 hypothetical protein CGMCC3_g10687 [Colletotrichum fructicola]